MGLPVSLAFKENNPRMKPKGMEEYANTIAVFNPQIHYNGTTEAQIILPGNVRGGEGIV